MYKGEKSGIGLFTWDDGDSYEGEWKSDKMNGQGAQAVIVTSYVFKDGCVNYENLDKIKKAVGKEHLVLDLSCRYRSEPGKTSGYYIVTDRWQKYTDEMVTPELLDELSRYCVIISYVILFRQILVMESPNVMLSYVLIY